MDGGTVAIKQVSTDSQEIEIALYFSQPTIRDDPRNHCVPILDHFLDDENPNIGYLVMPLLRQFDDPPLQFVEEVLEFVDQVMQVRSLFETIYS